MYSRNNSVSLSLFIAAALCFLLPFVNMTCQGQKIASFTGLDLAAGAKVEQPRLFEHTDIPEEPGSDRIEAETSATLALISTIAGCIWCAVMLVLKKKYYSVPAFLSILSFALLIILNFNLDSELLEQPQVEVLSLKLQAGYYFALFILLANGLYCLYMIFQERGTIISQPQAVSSVASSGFAAVNFCGNCGAANPLQNNYCIKCGHKLENIVTDKENK